VDGGAAAIITPSLHVMARSRRPTARMRGVGYGVT
jgi:hypothetical protein